MAGLFPSLHASVQLFPREIMLNPFCDPAQPLLPIKAPVTATILLLRCISSLVDDSGLDYLVGHDITRAQHVPGYSKHPLNVSQVNCKGFSRVPLEQSSCCNVLFYFSGRFSLDSLILQGRDFFGVLVCFSRLSMCNNYIVYSDCIT